MNIREAIRSRILILDGALGTMIQSYGLSEDDFRGSLPLLKMVTYKGNNDMLNITHPQTIADIHRRYLKAGADIIETNTFSSQRISQSDYHLQDYAHEMALEAGKARAAVCRRVFHTRKAPLRGRIGGTYEPDTVDKS